MQLSPLCQGIASYLNIRVPGMSSDVVVAAAVTAAVTVVVTLALTRVSTGLGERLSPKKRAARVTQLLDNADSIDAGGSFTTALLNQHALVRFSSDSGHGRSTAIPCPGIQGELTPSSIFDTL